MNDEKIRLMSVIRIFSVLSWFGPQCGLALHRKCMEVCQLECEHRKGILFGVGLALLQRDRPDEVPLVVQRCTAEIESRALTVQVLFIHTAV